MATGAPPTRDDRVITYTRGLSLFIAPFLLVAFVLLYFFRGDTKQLFAWTIKPTMTPTVLASDYLGGAHFFLRVLREQRWNVVKTGFLSVALFASFLGIATIIQLGRVQPPPHRLLAVGPPLLHGAVPGVRCLARQPAFRRGSRG